VYREAEMKIGDRNYRVLQGRPMDIGVEFTRKSLVSIVAFFSWVPEGEEAEPDYPYKLFTEYNNAYLALFDYRDRIKVEGKVLLSRTEDAQAGEHEVFNAILNEMLSSGELKGRTVVCQFLSVMGRDLRLCSFYRRRGKPVILYTESPIRLSYG
jgi:hypothetical protein